MRLDCLRPFTSLEEAEAIARCAGGENWRELLVLGLYPVLFAVFFIGTLVALVVTARRLAAN